MEIKRKTSARQRRYDVTGLLFCLPAIVFGAVFLLAPIVMAFGFSFTDFYMLTPQDTKFVFFDNYGFLLRDPIFWQSIKNTFGFVVVVVPAQCALAFALALLINRTARFFGVFKLAYFAPVITSMTVVALLFKTFYATPDGLFNLILGTLGIPPQGFLSDAQQAMGSILFMSVWQGAGYQMIIFLAALQGVPKDRFEAASIDGAGAWAKFRHITLPGVASVAGFVVLITLIGAFKLFTQPYIMTDGGPENATKTIVLYLYEVGMREHRVGMGSAISMLFTLAFVVCSLLSRGGAKLFARYGVYRTRKIEGGI